MGLSPFSSCDLDDPLGENSPDPQFSLSYPNPKNFVIEHIERNSHFVIARIHYPDCTNYEGRKILVFEKVTVDKIEELERIDPHFCDKDHISPVARFEPTEKGLRYARMFCATTSGIDLL